MRVGGREERDRGAAARARARAAVELLRRHEPTLKRTARRYSLCEDDAEEALQRAMEIVLTKAPSDDPTELIRWTQTVTKHEALALRRSRERVLPKPLGDEERETDWVAALPSEGCGPDERSERREDIARSREALRTLKRDELRALTLLAEGYSYAEIGAIAGFSRTKVNRCLAEGRERFRRVFAESEEGRRCAELRPSLSAFCDGELSEPRRRQLLEHLHACAHCRAVLRAYRATPGAVAALAPALPLGRTVLERAHDALGGLMARLPGRGGEADLALSQIAAGGGRGTGTAALAKLLAICAGGAGGAACAATGLVPAPLELPTQREERPASLQRQLDEEVRVQWSASSVEYEDDAPAHQPEPEPEPQPAPQPDPEPTPESEPEPEPLAPEYEASAGAVEYAPPPPAPTAPPTGTSASSGGGSTSSGNGSAAGEFGP